MKVLQLCIPDAELLRGLLLNHREYLFSCREKLSERKKRFKTLPVDETLELMNHEINRIQQLLEELK